MCIRDRAMGLGRPRCGDPDRRRCGILGWINDDEDDLRAGRGELEMPIPRNEIIETLDALAAPLGPQTSHDERLARQDRWVDEGGVELLEALLAVVASPPPEEQLQYSSLDDWN